MPVAASMLDHGISRSSNPSMVRICPSSFPSRWPSWRPSFLAAFPAASFDQLLHVVHHVSPATRYVTPQRIDEHRTVLVGLRGQHVLHVLRHLVESHGTVQLPHQPRRRFQQLLPRLPKRRHHRDLRQPRGQGPRHRLRALLRQVDQQMLEPRHPTPLRRRVGEQLGELPFVLPRLRSMIEYQRHDQRQPAFVRLLVLPPHPDLYTVIQHAQPYPSVRRGLVLQQHVQQDRCRVRLLLHREQQVGLAVMPVGADESCG